MVVHVAGRAEVVARDEQRLDAAEALVGDLSPERPLEQQRVPSVAAVARGHEWRAAFTPGSDDPVDRAGSQVRTVRENDHGRLGAGCKGGEPTAKGRARAAFPVGTVDGAFELVGACDDDDLVERSEAREDFREEQLLLRCAEPGRCAGGEDDGADQDSWTVTFSITTGCDGGPSPTPSAPIPDTTPMPPLMSPTIA